MHRCICVSLAIEADKLRRPRARGGGGLALDVETAAAPSSAFEFDQAPDRAECFLVALAAEGGEHAGVIAEGGDGGADAAAEWFVAGVSAEVVVAAGAGRLGNDLELAGITLELEHRRPAKISFENGRLAVGTTSVQVIERQAEPSQVVFPRRGDDVDAIREFVAPMDNAAERANDDVGPHDLRHRRISLWHRQGETWALIGARVGQRSLSVTADTYTHVLLDDRELDHSELAAQLSGRS